MTELLLAALLAIVLLVLALIPFAVAVTGGHRP